MGKMWICRCFWDPEYLIFLFPFDGAFEIFFFSAAGFVRGLTFGFIYTSHCKGRDDGCGVGGLPQYVFDEFPPRVEGFETVLVGHSSLLSGLAPNSGQGNGTLGADSEKLSQLELICLKFSSATKV